MEMMLLQLLWLTALAGLLFAAIYAFAGAL
jgi:hypothetical protein